jgi:hypothetical protein
MTLIEVGDKVRQDQHSVVHEVKLVIRAQEGSFRSIVETFCGKTGYASAFDLISNDKKGKKVETTCIKCKQQELSNRK